MRIRSVLVALILGAFASSAIAGPVSRIYEFQPGQVIRSNEVNEEFDNIISTINGNIDSTNILDGGVATGDIATNAVTTAKIASGNVTKLKLSAANIQFYNTAPFGTGQVDGIIASGTIATIGRPVRISFSPQENLPLNTSYIGRTTGAFDLQYSLKINGATENNGVIASSGAATYPCSSLLNYIDYPPAGTNTYEIYSIPASFPPHGVSFFQNCRMQLEEL